MSVDKSVWLRLGSAVLSVLHWMTGWLVHPQKGGCCSSDHEVIDSIESVFDKKEKE